MGGPLGREGNVLLKRSPSEDIVSEDPVSSSEEELKCCMAAICFGGSVS